MTELRPINIKNYLGYAGLLLICGFGIWLILSTGSRIHSQRTVTATPAEISQTRSPDGTYPPQSTSSAADKIPKDEGRSPVSILLLQLVVIIIAARLVGSVFHKIGQPRVMGEIVAGIVLGPSLLGWLFPGAVAFVFPAASMQTLSLLSQIGVALFMFVIGMDLDVGRLKKKARIAVLVSNASIIVPFFLGTAFSLLVYDKLASANSSFTAFALFMGIAMSVTAFPVLARILEDRQMSKTDLGSIALTCAAVDDATAWCMLALVIAVAKSASVSGVLLTIALALGFVGVMFLLVKPALFRLFTALNLAEPAGQKTNRGVMAGVLAFVFACALLTETIGIHALFGAFLAGVIMPQTAGLRERFKERLEPFVGAALLPLFFAFTGLRMQISLLNDWQSWAIAAAIVAVAISGKLGASMLMARWSGMNWRDSFSLGVLMNTRGLVELIVLNIGYDLGILSARLFAMLVLMALVTTFMTGPLLSLMKQPDG